MKTGLTKRQKTTSIFFTEDDPWIEVSTHNTDLKNRLKNYAEEYPAECMLTESYADGRRTYLILKGRFCFRLTAPYSEERRAQASAHGKASGFGTADKNASD